MNLACKPESLLSTEAIWQGDSDESPLFFSFPADGLFPGFGPAGPPAGITTDGVATMRTCVAGRNLGAGLGIATR